jgi:2-polyprenyl-6-methoxyphenol hydroxylase-like FAD-dependent oxidoreductase
MLLARHGHKVLLVDRATFPSDLPQGHFVHWDGPRRLNRWGLLDKIVASGCPPIATLISDFGDFPLVAADVAVDGVAWAYGPRRKVLDQILVAAAVEAGAELREGCAVEGFLWDGDRMTGIQARESGCARLRTERARIVIGADGRNSHLARTVCAPRYEDVPPLLCWYFSYWRDVPHAGFEMYVKHRRVVIGHPTNDGLFTIFVGWPVEEFQAVRSDIEESSMAALGLVPDLAERVRSGQRAERFYGTADLPNFFRKPYGPGWALVGDAGYHKDPFMALGVSDALRDAELLSDAIHEGLSGQRPLEGALADYERRRNEAAMPCYQQNLNAARFRPYPPELYQLRAAVRGNPEETRRFFLARYGMIPPEQFFNPENVQRLLTGARDARVPVPA